MILNFSGSQAYFNYDILIIVKYVTHVLMDFEK